MLYNYILPIMNFLGHVCMNYVSPWYNRLNRWIPCRREKTNSRSLECKDKVKVHTYDISSDILKLVYFVQGNAHKICISRDRSKDEIQKIYERIKSSSTNTLMQQYPVIYAQFNDEVDITDRLNQYLGNGGCHLKISGEKIKLRWILTDDEIKEFKKIKIFTDKLVQYEFVNVDDIVLL